MISRSQSTVANEEKKGNYMTEELINLVLRALRKEDKYESDIFQIQEKIKGLHNDMALKNL